MVTRLRFSQSVAAAVSPTFQSYTHNNGARARLARTDSTTLTTAAYAPDAADHIVAGDAAILQFVSDNMAAGNVFTSGNVVKWAAQVLEANAGNNLSLQVWVGVVDSTGATPRATIRSKVTGGTEMNTTIQNRFLSSTLSGSYTTVAGDRLVVEFSGVGTPVATSGTQGHNWSFRRGNSGAGGDLGENETDIGATLNPWIEFATTIVWDDQTSVPTVMALTWTGDTPIVAVPDAKLAVPTVLAMTWTGATPTVTKTENVTAAPTVLAMTWTGATPTVAAPRLSQPTTLALTWTGATPAIVTPVAAQPTTLAMTWSGSTPVVLNPVATQPTVLAMSWTGDIPVVLNPVAIAPTSLDVTWTGATPAVSAADNEEALPDALELALSFGTPDIAQTIYARPEALAMALAFGTPVIKRPKVCHATALSISLAWATPFVEVSAPGSSQPIPFALTGVWATPQVKIASTVTPTKPRRSLGVSPLPLAARPKVVVPKPLPLASSWGVPEVFILDDGDILAILELAG